MYININIYAPLYVVGKKKRIHKIVVACGVATSDSFRLLIKMSNKANINNRPFVVHCRLV